MSEKTLPELAEQMADAIREWNRAKLERESWVPVVGQVPPVGILGSAKNANAMLSKALADYEAFQHSVQRTACQHPNRVTNSLGGVFCRDCDERI